MKTIIYNCTWKTAKTKEQNLIHLINFFYYKIDKDGDYTIFLKGTNNFYFEIAEANDYDTIKDLQNRFKWFKVLDVNKYLIDRIKTGSRSTKPVLLYLEKINLLDYKAKAEANNLIIQTEKETKEKQEEQDKKQKAIEAKAETEKETKEIILEAIKDLKKGKFVLNDCISIFKNWIEKTTSLLNYLLEKNGVITPIKTKGWINKQLNKFDATGAYYYKKTESKTVQELIKKLDKKLKR